MLLNADTLRIGGLGPWSLHVSAGEIVAIWGPSGSGKTRLLRSLADLEPHQGAVSLAGVPMQAVSPSQWRRSIGYLPAESRWWYETSGEHFATSAVSSDTLGQLGLTCEHLQRPVARLSSGERQRLALIRLLANLPRILLLDEPTANLDPVSTIKVESVLLRYTRRRSAGLLWVSHDAAQRRRIADRGYRLSGGALEEAPP